MKPKSYSEYLSLDAILKSSEFAQEHNAHLNFVISHQITELWLKLLNKYLVHYLNQQSLSSLLAAEAVMKQINNIWEVFEHIPAKDFLKIREVLQGISGSESIQYAETSNLIASIIEKCSDANSIQTLSRIDSTFQKWKISHINITIKLIGDLPGTGGSKGAVYLQEKGTQSIVNHKDLNKF